jgi:Mg-chelatase subunit ChlD
MEIQEINAKLSEYDFVVVLDTSGSMGEAWKGSTRYEAMQESVMAFVRDIAKLDSDGIDIVQLGGSVRTWTGAGPEVVKDIFSSMAPRGGTPLAEALEAAFKLAGKSEKKDFIIVFTDGVPDDKKAAAEAIKRQANRQETDDACTVLFVQVGDDRQATAYLKSLDDDLKGAKFDIVDAKTIEEAEKFATTAELVLAAIAD